MTDDPATVTAMLAGSAAAVGDAPAIFYGDRTIGYRSLEQESRRAAAGLKSLGIGDGDRVAFWLPNTPAYLALYFACARLGAIAVAVNTRYRAAEVEDVLDRTGAKAVVMWPGFRGIDFPGLLENVDPAALTRLEVAILYGEAGETIRPVPGVRRVETYEALLQHGVLDTDLAEPLRGCNTFTTSGTTKAPKFVLHSNASMAIHAADVRRDFDYDDPTTVALVELPLCGVFGFTSALAALASGRPMVMTAAFEADRTVALMARHKVTHFDGSDEMIDRLLGATDREDIFARIGFVGYAMFNSYLDDIVERAERRGLFAVGLWGMSEMQALVARRDRDDPPEERRKGGGRLVSPRASARVRNPDSGALCPDGVAGELEITGPSRMTEYYGNVEATADTITADGYVRTGDLARMEPGGKFEYLTRMGDVLRLGGFLVSPAEIEAEVQAHPSVAGVQVVAAPIDGADRAVAFVVPEAGIAFDPTAIQAHCAARLAKYKVPARVVRLDAFPVTESPNGVKIQRVKLRQMALDLAKPGG